jgi:hypothetical protein
MTHENELDGSQNNRQRIFAALQGEIVGSATWQSLVDELAVLPAEPSLESQYAELEQDVGGAMSEALYQVHLAAQQYQ